MPFEAELQTYRAALPHLLANAQGKFALIRGSEIAGTFDTREDARQVGYRRYGAQPFLVKECVAEEPSNAVKRADATGPTLLERPGHAIDVTLEPMQV